MADSPNVIAIVSTNAGAKPLWTQKSPPKIAPIMTRVLASKVSRPIWVVPQVPQDLETILVGD